MNIISKDLIENIQAKDMNKIFKMNPTTQVSGRNATNSGDIEWVTIRGFNSSNPIVNGISYATSTSSSPMMQDIERVEIISGATGFLYGGGRVGGAVNYITKKPTTKDLRNLTIGSYGKKSYYGHIDLGGQFDENHTFGYRVNALYQNGELPDTSEKEQKYVSLVFDWKPTDNLYTDIKYLHKNSIAKGTNSFFSSWIPNLDRSSVTKNKSYSPKWVENEIKTNKVENNIRFDINDIFTLRTNLFYEKMKHRADDSNVYVQNGMVISHPTGWYSYFSKGAWQETENYGYNLYLDSKFDTGNINHTLTLGYSSNSSKNSQPSDAFVGYLIDRDMTLSEFKNLSEPNWNDPSIGTLGTQPLKPVTKREYKNILIGDDIVFNEQFSALVGVNYATIINPTYRNGIETSKYDVSELTPTLSLIYKPFDELTTYATYIESLENGTIVGTRYQNANEILDPYVSKQYEVGAKYSILEEKALLTASLFRIEKANQYEDKTTSPKPTLTQDGKQIHQGIELGITGKVTENLTLISGVTFMDLSLEKHTNASLEGKKPTQAATKMAKMFTEYNIPFIQGLSVNGGAYYTGKRYVDELNNEILPSYVLFDAGLRYKTKLDKYPTTFNLNAHNLTDKQYWTHRHTIGDSRAIAFSMKMEF